MEGNSGLDFLAQIPPDQVQYTRLLTRSAVAKLLEENTPVRPKRDDRWRENRDGQQAAYLKAWTTP